MNIPNIITAGDAYEWSEDVSSPLATSTYKIILTDPGKSPVTLTGTISGNTITFSVSSETSAAFSAGERLAILYEIRTDNNRYMLDESSVKILPDPTSSSDTRSHVKKTLDLIEAAIEDQASDLVLSKSVDGISLSFCSPDKLLELREKYSYLYQCELNGGRPPLPGAALVSWRR